MDNTKNDLQLTNILLAILTSIAVIAALKASYSVTLPLAFALFLIILAWPLFKWLNARLPQKIAYVLTLMALLAIFSAFAGTLFYSGKVIADAAPRYAQEAQHMWQQTRAKAQSYDVTLPANPRDIIQGGSRQSESTQGGSGQESSGSNGQRSNGQQGSSRASQGVSLLKSLVSMVGLWLLVFGLLVLGLHEAPKFRKKLYGVEESMGQGDEDGHQSQGKLVQAIDQVIEKCGRYFLTRTAVSAIQGVCSGGAALAMGLDLAFIWGLTAALLNYIPTVGSLLSVIPPTLFALFQFLDPGHATLVFVVMCAIQVGLGTFVDPLIEGRQLQISSFVVLFSIAFWGWVWGVAGALIGVPLTITILIFCAQFPGTKWLADLFTDIEGATAKSPPS